ncbi:hypothetical protein CQ010_07815 [Arthrobacter sp. MYb211]|uniref:HesA/MoeB/ThiF family protein n=1 Tax=unclassified Arthrobacter TaxID=235627 RepID=UPI000CFD9FB9|nr:MULTISPECIES: ThiF family adenylyltransferase [unclassified Arthrobacter]PRA11976.1 hypothetical protein CQ015_08510 [Arthrobacter sp. MYb221]PRC08331.1 hypothetical protein CQ010_07815 [Arthrobacter sp. MYb211]
MEVVLKPGHRTMRVTEGLLIVGETKRYLFRGLSDEDMIWVEGLAAGNAVNFEEALKRLWSNKLVRALEAADLFTSLPRDIAPAIESRQLGYLANFVQHPTVAQSAIRNSTVAIFGLGGTGVNILEHLVGAGVEKFILIDGDCVNLDNLNRQYAYRLEDIGRPKTEAAATYVLTKRPEAKVTAINQYIDSQSDTWDALSGSSVDLAVICLDMPIGYGSDLVTRSCWESGVPSLFGGVGLRRGFYGPVYCPERSIQEPKFPHRDGTVEERSGVPYSFGPTNSLISSLMAAQAIHHLAGDHKNVEYNVTRNVNFQSGLVVDAEGNDG